MRRSEVIGLLKERTAAVKEKMVHILEISSPNMGFISKNVQLRIDVLTWQDRILKIRFYLSHTFHHNKSYSNTEKYFHFARG